MYCGTESYGKVRMNTYIPSPQAKTYLNFYHSVGWHCCNTRYHQNYPFGCEGTFLLLTVSGSGKMICGDRCFVLRPNTLFLLPPDTRMEYYTDPSSESWTFYWLTAGGRCAENLCRYLIEKSGNLSPVPDPFPILSELKSIIETNPSQLSEWALSLKISAFLEHTAAALLPAGQDSPLLCDTVKQATDYIEAHYAEEIRLSDLSRRVFLSVNQFLRVFQAQTGYSPYQYVKQYRLLKARELLQLSHKSIQEISFLTGFSSPSHFIAQFKGAFGRTPASFRKTIL